MGRNKQTPKKISHSITIVGAAAHSIWADDKDKDYYKEAYGQDVNTTHSTIAKPTTKRKLVTPEKNNDEDDDNDVVFDNQSASAPRNLFGVKDDTNKNIHVVDKKRRIINDDDDDCDDTDKETNGLQLSSNDYSIIDGTPTSNAFELISFQLNINITLNGGSNNDIRNTSIVLESMEAVETILKFCNESLDSTDDNLDIDHIVQSYREGMLNLIVTLSDEGKVNVSIRLLINPCLEKLSTSSSSPPIPVPRRQPGWRHRFTQPTPSYTLIQALGAIFKQSVFDNVAETLLNKQYYLEQKNAIITAKDVYGQVDNAHSNEFSGSEALNRLDIPELLPTLRPYQSAAVRWMLKREEEIPSAESNEWELCWFVITERPNIGLDEAEGSGVARTSNILPLVEWKLLKSSPTERFLLVNPFNGEIANTYDEAKSIMLGDEDNTHVRGGILAESMGLGKTVEVLACILANKAPSTFQSPSPGTQVYRGDPLIPTSHSTTKPSSLHDATCICGRSTSYRDCLSWVVCKDCGEEMHGRCAGFARENELVTNTEHDSNSGIRICSCEYCPTCAATKPAVKSRATLIVTPPSILSQWEREISRHTKMPETGRPLKVVVYPGVRELCKSGSSSPHDDFHLVHPRHLANADIVLCTFQTLMADLGHSDDNPFAFAKGHSSSLRSRKRYGVLPSPLICIEWWRVCLDEAQRVEAPTSTSARMAHKLKTDRRWCVSGTPIGRGKLDDLYGLLLFLSFKPFDNKQWFLNSFIPSHGDVSKRLSHLLRHILWRSTKANALVRQQMGIPEQEEIKILLQFSKLEEYFYKKQYEETSRVVNSWSQRRGLNMLSNSLQKLRAACCHPQVGASGVGSARSNVVLSMDQILQKLVDESREKCCEAQRIAIMHTIGLASLTKLKANEVDEEADMKLLQKSESIYQEALDLADSNASPSEIIGEAILKGCVGFRSDHLLSSSLLDWIITPLASEDVQSSSTWTCIDFVGISPQINCLKVRSISSLPSDLQEEQLVVLYPKECTLQMLNASGGGFIDIHSFTVSEDGELNVISGFRAKKSKTWRLVIKSYHNESQIGQRRCYTGLKCQFFEPDIADDSLQRLHILHNMSNVLTTLIQAANSDEKQSKLKAMESEEQVLYNEYMGHAQTIHCQRKHQFKTAVRARVEVDKELEELSEDTNRSWYEDALAWIAIYGDQQSHQRLCESVGYDLLGYYDNMNNNNGVSQLDGVLIRRGKFPNYTSVDGLQLALAMRIQQGEDEVGSFRQENWSDAVTALSSQPTNGEVCTNAQCRRCRSDWEQTGPVCQHCHLEDDLIKVEKLSNDPEIMCVLKSICRFVQTNTAKVVKQQHKSYLKNIQQRAGKWFDLQSKQKEEIKVGKLVWRSYFDLLSDIDELNQCKRSMRLKEEGEDITFLSRNEAAFIVEPSTVDMEIMEHEAKQASALAELRRCKSSLTYLKSQRSGKDKSTSEDDNATNSCSICLASFDGDPSEKAVLPCGHVFHSTCIDQIFNRHARTVTIKCPMRCPTLLRREDIFLASNEKKQEAVTKKISRDIKGDFGSKVNRLVADVMDSIQLGDKGIVFSQWEEMLDVVAEALRSNQIQFIRPKSGKRFGEDIKRYRSGSCPVLLMNVKNSAEGLTLTEATHCFMLEPLLNCGLDAQAINRIHRIGQTRKTFVHRYIVENTIEEKIDVIRIERQENHFENDIEEQQRHSIKGGGLDGGFDESELRQLFG